MKIGNLNMLKTRAFLAIGLVLSLWAVVQLGCSKATVTDGKGISVYGQVRDSITGLSLPIAWVTWGDTVSDHVRDYTNSVGEYYLGVPIPPSHPLIIAGKEGYRTKTRTLPTPIKDEMTGIDFELVRDSM
ncbi:MAG: hypothetical protein NT028_10515 [candidate division Zixibacteria bacterium]|nr:hypothetical protein [candidate division Zixibacteria bacterium]